MYIFWYVNMPNVTSGYGSFSESIAFFGNFHILQRVWNVIASSKFYKLCVKVEVYRWKVNLCNHIWLH